MILLLADALQGLIYPMLGRLIEEGLINQVVEVVLQATWERQSIS